MVRPKYHLDWITRSHLSLSNNTHIQPEHQTPNNAKQQRTQPPLSTPNLNATPQKLNGTISSTTVNAVDSNELRPSSSTPKINSVETGRNSLGIPKLYRLSPWTAMNGDFPPPQIQLRRNWTELPDDATASILSRLMPIDVFRAQRVCRLWRRICKHHLASSIRSMDLCRDLCRKPPHPYRWCIEYFTKFGLDKVARQIVYRSSGNLVDINLKSRCKYVVVTDDLLRYIVQSSKQIKRLAIECRHDGITDAGLRSVAPELGMLEELEITLQFQYHVMPSKTLELVGRSCPLFKSFKLSANWGQLYSNGWHFDPANGQTIYRTDVGCNDIAHAIARTMQGLQHLKLQGNELEVEGLLGILDSCPLLQSLDLTYCFSLCFDADLETRCEHIKNLVQPGILLI